MKYLCLIYLNETEMAAMPDPDMRALNAEHWALNDQLRDSRHFIEAEALQPARDTACVRMRGGKPVVTDGPYAEVKEMIAGFYLVEARDLHEAAEIAARIPAARIGTVEVRPTRELIV